MPFGENKQKVMLEEGSVFLGLFNNPHLIGTIGNGDPFSSFSGDNVGFFRQGTLAVTLPRSYAEFLARTPTLKVRKDLIRKDFLLNLEAAQMNADLMALAFGMRTQPNFSDGGFVGDLGWLGSNEPVQPENGYLIVTRLTDGTPFYIAMWAGKVTTEDLGLTFPGTTHVGYNIKVESFQHNQFASSGTDAEKHYGLMWTDNS